MAKLIPSGWYLFPGAYEIHFVGAVGFTSFLVICVLACMENPSTLKARFYWVTGIAAAVFLTALELSQYFQPGRDLQLGDGVAQLLGVGAELCLTRWWHSRTASVNVPLMLKKTLS